MTQIHILEDDEACAGALAELLIRQGHEPKCFTAPHEFFYKLTKLPPRGAIIDWMLPEMSGIEVVVSTLPPEVVLPDGFWRSLSRRVVVLDMNYGTSRATVRDRALTAGLRAADGLGPFHGFDATLAAAPGTYQACATLVLWDGVAGPALPCQAVTIA